MAPAHLMGPMATLQEQLDEAIAARHAWRTGKTKSSQTLNTPSGDRTIQYSTEGLSEIDAYIADLQRQISGKRKVRNRISFAVPD